MGEKKVWKLYSKGIAMTEVRTQLEPDAPSPRLHVSADEAIYGTLWRSGNLNMPYELARKFALAAIGGKGSDGQRRAIEWACSQFPPPDDFDVWSLDGAATNPDAFDSHIGTGMAGAVPVEEE